MVEAVARGVDMFDCVLPTRLARHGTALTSTGRVQLKNAAQRTDPGPIDEACGCSTCARNSRGYLRHLLQVGEPSAARLVTMHNLAWMFALIGRMRSAIETGTFDELRAEVSDIWDRPASN
jgi:queuine tRNA-ribosyltransferase